MAPGGRRYDTRTRWPCWNLGSTGLISGSSLSSTSPMLERRQVGHVFKRIRCLDIYVQYTDFIFFFNLLILMLATNFCFSGEKKGGVGGRNLHSDVLESAFSLCNFLFLA